MHRFDVKTIKNVELRRKPFKTTQIYKSNQNYRWIASIWCQNDKKCWVTSQTIRNNSKTTKVIKLRWIASIWCENNQNNAKLPKAIKLRWICIDLTSKRSKMLSYVANHSKQLQIYKSNQITMNCIDLT